MNNICHHSPGIVWYQNIFLRLTIQQNPRTLHYTLYVFYRQPYVSGNEGGKMKLRPLKESLNLCPQVFSSGPGEASSSRNRGVDQSLGVD